MSDGSVSLVTYACVLSSAGYLPRPVIYAHVSVYPPSIYAHMSVYPWHLCLSHLSAVLLEEDRGLEQPSPWPTLAWLSESSPHSAMLLTLLQSPPLASGQELLTAMS